MHLGFAMWLKYGVDEHETLVNILDITRGKTSLKCPYCDCRLTAKKGNRKEHHFAHTEETCRPVAKHSFPVLPLYDNFNIHLSGKDLQQLKLLWKEYGLNTYPISYELITSSLIKAGLLKKNVYTVPPGYEFTPFGKIPVGALEFALFNSVQEPLLFKKLLKLELAFNHALHKNAPDLAHRFTDLKLYRAQLKRILSCTLYFLEIHTSKETLYKIGVTQRSIAQRVSEIEFDLRSLAGGRSAPSHYQNITIQVLGAWSHRGNVELYFKHRYRDFNYPIGSLTEYYKFSTEDALFVLRDLQEMKAKALSPVEIDILEDKPNPILVAV